MSDTDLVERLLALVSDLIDEDIEYIKAADLLMEEAAAALASRDATIGGLKAALAASDYLISRLDAVVHGKVVRDLDEAWVHRNSAIRAFAASSKEDGNG